MATVRKPHFQTMSRTLLPLLCLLILPASLPVWAQPADLVSAFDAALNQPPEHPRVSVESGKLVIRTASCASTFVVRPRTSVQQTEGGVNPFSIHILSPGSRVECTSMGYDTDKVHYRFESAAARDRALAAGRALIAGWSGRASSNETIFSCASGDCTNGSGTAEYRRDGAVVLTYQGEFKDGLPHGQGSYTEDDGDHFVGEFAAGYEVRGTKTYADGDVYVGEFEGGLFNGRGRYTFGPGEYEGDVMEATFANDFPVHGTYTWTSGQVYTGDWDGWKRFGEGRLDYVNGNSYEGGWLDGQRHGRGTFTFASGGVFTGDWVDDARVRGTERYAGGGVYEGEYLDDKRHGSGRFAYANGDVYDGMWSANVKHGQGRFTWGQGEFEGDVYEGQYVEGQRQGFGTYTWSDGKVYTGNWEAGKRQGHGVMTWPSGQRYEGQWQDGLRTGQGTQRYSDGRVFTGTWTADEPIEGLLTQVGAEPRPVRVEDGQFVYVD